MSHKHKWVLFEVFRTPAGDRLSKTILNFECECGKRKQETRPYNHPINIRGY